MRSCIVLAKAVVIAILAGPLSGQEPINVEGTYAFRVLTGDGEEVVAQGQFVLFAEQFDLEQVEDGVISVAREQSFWLLRGERQVRVCFGFERSAGYVGDREFYGGIIPVGLSDWTVEGDEIRIRVYQSPDASQYLAGSITEQGLEGRVLQQDWNASSTGAPFEWLPFEAERIGEASTDRCEQVLRIVGERGSGGSALVMTRVDERTDHGMALAHHIRSSWWPTRVEAMLGRF